MSYVLSPKPHHSQAFNPSAVSFHFIELLGHQLCLFILHIFSEG